MQNLDLDVTSLFSLVLIILALFLTFYTLIVIPAKIQIRQISLIKNKLKPGVKIIAYNGIAGTIILVLNKTVVVEQKNGQKVEIIKRSIKSIDE